MKQLLPILIVLFVLLALAFAVATGIVFWLSGSSNQAVGTILVYEIESSPGDRQPSLGTQMVAAIERRLNPGWSRNAEVRRLEDGRIEVGVFGSDPRTVQRVERLLENAGTLEFRILANRNDHKPLIDRALDELEQDSDRLTDGAGDLLAWWVPVEQGAENSVDYEEIARRTKTDNGRETVEVLVVNDPFDVNGAYLQSVVPDVDYQGQPCLAFQLDNKGANLFGGLTSANLPSPTQGISRNLGIILNGHLHSAPAIQSTIRQRGQITGSFSRQEVEELATVLNSGSIPAPIKQVEKRAGKK